MSLVKVSSQSADKKRNRGGKSERYINCFLNFGCVRVNNVICLRKHQERNLREMSKFKVL